jgi:hypothetical protein
MKKIVLLISICYALKGTAQGVDPALFQTWYLYSITTRDLGPGDLVSDIEPAITPTLTVLEDLSFSGVGACNTFNGSFTEVGPNAFLIDEFTETEDDCEFQSHQDFESQYFQYMRNANAFVIRPIEGGMELDLGATIFGEAIFRNFTLNTSVFEANQIDIFPNPTDGLVHLKMANNRIQNVELYDTLGQKVKTFQPEYDVIDISQLERGIYIMKLKTASGVLTQKIVKN